MKLSKLRLLLMFVCGGVFVYALLDKRLRELQVYEDDINTMAEITAKSTPEQVDGDKLFADYEAGKEARFQEKVHRLEAVS